MRDHTNKAVLDIGFWGGEAEAEDSKGENLDPEFGGRD